MSNEASRIDEQWEKIEKNLNFLGEKIPDLKSYIDSFEKGLNAIALNFQRAYGNIQKRQFLIDLQCNKKIFIGPVHEKYHSVTEQLDVEFDIYLSSIKTALNRLPGLIYEILDHSNKRDLRIKSFGSFLNSIESKDFKSKNLMDLKNVLLTTGRKIDETINDYRDKNIEHIENPSGYGLISDKRGVRRHHFKIDSGESAKENLEEFKKRIESLPMEKRSVAITIKTTDNKYVHYVHLESDKKSGDFLKKGDSIGRVSDRGSGHFEKYGPHAHIFTSPDLPIERIIPEGNFSPSAFESINLLTDFLDSVIASLVEFVKSGSA